MMVVEFELHEFEVEHAWSRIHQVSPRMVG